MNKTVKNIKGRTFIEEETLAIFLDPKDHNKKIEIVVQKKKKKKKKKDKYKNKWCQVCIKVADNLGDKSTSNCYVVECSLLKEIKKILKPKK